jgi:hypothetical protein
LPEAPETMIFSSAPCAAPIPAGSASTTVAA